MKTGIEGIYQEEDRARVTKATHCPGVSHLSLACHVLLYGLQNKNAFYVFQWLEKTKKLNIL